MLYRATTQGYLDPQATLCSMYVIGNVNSQATVCSGDTGGPLWVSKPSEAEIGVTSGRNNGIAPLPNPGIPDVDRLPRILELD
jgi:hypothetical protein